MFGRLRDGYQAGVGHVLGARLRYLAVFVLIVGLMGFLFLRMPTAYLPDEDQGALLALIQTPPGSTLEQTMQVLDTVRSHFLENEKETVESFLTVAGFSAAGLDWRGFVRINNLFDRDIIGRMGGGVEDGLRVATRLRDARDRTAGGGGSRNLAARPAGHHSREWCAGVDPPRPAPTR